MAGCWGGILREVCFRALLLLCLLACGSSASAQFFEGADDGGEDDPFDVTADTVEFDTDRQVYIARGNVRIVQPDTTIEADWVAFSNETQQGVASGNVVIREGGDILYAEVLNFEIEGLRGIIYDGRLDADSSFQISGQEIRKVGEQEFEFDDASFTTCRCPDEEARQPWRIDADTAKLEFGGYATTRNTTFNILGVPVLWTPWMRYPLKSNRETGFLFPEFIISGRNGFGVALPFFWAARDNINVTFTNAYLADNGYKPSVEVEYVFGERSVGEMYGTYIDDDDIDPDDVSSPFDSQRWAAEWIHDQYLPNDWRFKINGRVFSDNRYPFDFPDFSRYSDDRYIEALAFVDKRFGTQNRYGFTTEVRWADDIQNPDDQDRDDFLIQRLPDVRLAGLPNSLSFLERAFASFDVRYTHFTAQKDADSVYPEAIVVGDDVFLDTGADAIPNGEERNANGDTLRLDGSADLRDGTTLTAEEVLVAQAEGNPRALALVLDGSGDDAPGGPENDGRFQEGEPIADRGHRVVLNPRLALPFRIMDTVEVYPELAYHGTFYSTDGQSGEVRNLVTGLLDFRSRLRRTIDLPFNRGRVVHMLEPRFTYTGITSDSQRSNPLFIPRPFVLQERVRDMDPFTMVRDPSDRIESVNAVTLGLGNRLYVPGLVEEAPPRLFADVNLALHHDFADDDLSAFYIDGTLLPTRRTRMRFSFGYDLDENDFAETLLQASWSTETGHDLRLTYRYVEDIPRFFEDFEFDDERFDEFDSNFLEINQIDFFTRLAVTRNWGLTYRLRYSFEDEIILSNQGGVEYLSKCKCWAIRVEVGDDRNRGAELSLQYRVIGLGDDTVRPFSDGRRTGREPLIEQ